MNIYVENDVTFGGRVSCDETVVAISDKCRIFWIFTGRNARAPDSIQDTRTGAHQPRVPADSADHRYRVLKQ